MKETLNLIDTPEFLLMKKTTLLVNQSRGKVLNETALVQALKQGLIGGYATDVYEKEPPAPDSELLGFKNVITTPHIAGSTRESRTRSAEIILEDVSLVMRGETPINLAKAF